MKRAILITIGFFVLFLLLGFLVPVTEIRNDYESAEPRAFAKGEWENSGVIHFETGSPYYLVIVGDYGKAISITITCEGGETTGHLRAERRTYDDGYRVYHFENLNLQGEWFDVEITTEQSGKIPIRCTKEQTIEKYPFLYYRISGV